MTDHPAPMTISDREVALKFAELTADNKDGFGYAFYNASLVRFAIEIARWRDEQWRKAEATTRRVTYTCPACHFSLERQE